MKLTELEVKIAVCNILKGIDREESDSENCEGWWETSTGKEFGAERLSTLLEFLNRYDLVEKEIK